MGTGGWSEIRSVVSRSITSVLAAPPADGDAPGDPLVPGVPAGAQAAARTSAMARKIDDWRMDICALPLRVVDEPNTGSFGDPKGAAPGLTSRNHLLTLRSSSGGGPDRCFGSERLVTRSRAGVGGRSCDSAFWAPSGSPRPRSGRLSLHSFG